MTVAFAVTPKKKRDAWLDSLTDSKAAKRKSLNKFLKATGKPTLPVVVANPKVPTNQIWWGSSTGTTSSASTITVTSTTGSSVTTNNTYLYYGNVNAATTAAYLQQNGYAQYINQQAQMMQAQMNQQLAQYQAQNQLNAANAMGLLAGGMGTNPGQFPGPLVQQGAPPPPPTVQQALAGIVSRSANPHLSGSGHPIGAWAPDELPPDLELYGDYVARPGQNFGIVLPDGSKLRVMPDGTWSIDRAKSKISYKGANRDFNRYLNASDLLEDFISYVGGIDKIAKADFMRLPIDLFIAFVVVRAAETDGEEPPPDAKARIEEVRLRGIAFAPSPSAFEKEDACTPQINISAP